MYKEISDKVNAVYRDYTDYVEPASIDESYLDMTEVVKRRNCTPEFLADRLRARVKREIGITISVGVSYCKVFAKMGSVKWSRILKKIIKIMDFLLQTSVNTGFSGSSFVWSNFIEVQIRPSQN